MAVNNWNHAESSWEEVRVTGTMLAVTGIYWERQAGTGIILEATGVMLALTGTNWDHTGGHWHQTGSNWN